MVAPDVPTPREEHPSDVDREHRVRRRSDYAHVQRRGRRLAHPLLRVQWAANELAVTRFGVVVSKRVAPRAHDRNLVRRRLRELARQSLPHLPGGVDVVLVAQPPSRTAAFAELAQAFQQLLRRSHLVRCPDGPPP